MDYSFTQELYKSLEIELQNGNDVEINIIDRYAHAIELIRGKLRELETHIKVHPMRDVAEEVQYFKKVYPMFCSQLIYYSESYNLEKYLQLIDRNEWIIYLNEELKAIPRFFKRNSFLYEYYRLGLTELDDIYFTSGGVKSHLIPEFPSLDFSAAATVSYSLAKIIAFERLRESIRAKLDNLESSASNDVSKQNKDKLKWTGDVINLVELAYGIYLTGQLNNGNASLNQIVRWLEANLQVSIGIIQRRFTEIASRKRLSPTKLYAIEFRKPDAVLIQINL
jgi:hypothetical protein